MLSFVQTDKAYLDKSEKHGNWEARGKGLVMESTMDTSQMNKLLPSKKNHFVFDQLHLVNACGFKERRERKRDLKLFSSDAEA